MGGVHSSLLLACYNPRPPLLALSTASSQVRLEHMLQRLRVLQQASLTGRPVRLMQRLYLSGAGGEWGGAGWISCFCPVFRSHSK